MSKLVTPEMVEFVRGVARWIDGSSKPYSITEAYLASLDKPQVESLATNAGAGDGVAVPLTSHPAPQSPVREAGETYRQRVGVDAVPSAPADEWPKWTVATDGIISRWTANDSCDDWQRSGNRTGPWTGLDHYAIDKALARKSVRIITHSEAVALIPAIAKDYPLPTKPADEWPADVVKVWEPKDLPNGHRWLLYTNGKVFKQTATKYYETCMTEANMDARDEFRLIFDRTAQPAKGEPIESAEWWRDEADRLRTLLASAERELAAAKRASVPEFGDGYYVAMNGVRFSVNIIAGGGTDTKPEAGVAIITPVPPPPGAAS